MFPKTYAMKLNIFVLENKKYVLRVQQIFYWNNKHLDKKLF